MNIMLDYVFSSIASVCNMRYSTKVIDVVEILFLLGIVRYHATMTSYSRYLISFFSPYSCCFSDLRQEQDI